MMGNIVLMENLMGVASSAGGKRPEHKHIRGLARGGGDQRLLSQEQIDAAQQKVWILSC